MSIISRLFSTTQFMPHGCCYEWDPFVIWLHVISDGLITLAYFSIPVTLVYFVRKRKDVTFDWMFLCFAVFIIACGTTHLLEIISIWHPLYWFSGMIKAITAITSLVTAILLIRLMPIALAIPSHEQMRKANEALQFEIMEKTNALKKIESLNLQLTFQSQKVEAINRELERFTYSISHDLRAPLRAMLGYSKAVLEDCSDHLSEVATDYLSRIIKAAERLDRLILDLLEYSKVSTEEMKVEKIDLNQLLRTVLQDYPDLNGRNPAIRIEGRLPIVVGYRAGLVQIFANLIGNGLKFVKEGCEPKVLVSSEVLPGIARIWFKDNGVGISEVNQIRIFNLFERVNGGNKYSGTGIGLALVKKAVERMHGSVGVHSEEGKGSQFWIDLPLVE